MEWESYQPIERARKTTPACSVKAKRQARRKYESKRKATPDLARSERYRRSPEWARLRARIMRSNPICQRCGATCASQVHHIVPIRQGFEKAFSQQNLMAVCTGCHAILEREEKKIDG